MASTPTPASTALPGSGATATSTGGAATPVPPSTTTTTGSTSAPTTTKPTKKKATAKKASGAGTKAKTKTNTGNASATQPRKRKTTNTAARHQLMANDARASAATLSQQQANTLARRSDPLWYRMEDVVPAATLPPVGASLLPQSGASHNGEPKKAGGHAAAVEEFQALEHALHRYGKTRADVTPQALACLLEHARRYRQEVWQDAREYAEAAGRHADSVTPADLQLAADFRHDSRVALSAQLPKLLLLAQQVNRQPLPPIPSHVYGGIRLPPEAFQVTARTFDVVCGAAAAQKRQLPLPRAPARSSSKSQAALYGAARGRQIPIHLKTAAAPVVATAVAPVAPTTTVAPTVAEPAAPTAPPTVPPTVPADPMDTTATPSTSTPTAPAVPTPTTMTTPAPATTTTTATSPAAAEATATPPTTLTTAGPTPTDTGPTPMDVSSPTPMDISESSPTTAAAVTSTAATTTTTTANAPTADAPAPTPPP